MAHQQTVTSYRIVSYFLFSFILLIHPHRSANTFLEPDKCKVNAIVYFRPHFPHPSSLSTSFTLLTCHFSELARFSLGCES